MMGSHRSQAQREYTYKGNHFESLIRNQEQIPHQKVNSGSRLRQCRVDGRSVSFRLGIASCFFFAKPASEMGHKKFLGKFERNNNGDDVIGRRLNPLVPGS
jgi:hypothetical protein